VSGGSCAFCYSCHEPLVPSICWEFSGDGWWTRELRSKPLGGTDCPPQSESESDRVTSWLAPSVLFCPVVSTCTCTCGWSSPLTVSVTVLVLSQCTGTRTVLTAVVLWHPCSFSAKYISADQALPYRIDLSLGQPPDYTCISPTYLSRWAVFLGHMEVTLWSMLITQWRWHDDTPLLPKTISR